MTSVGFTGTRQGMRQTQWITFINELGSGPGEFHQGGAYGSDMEAHDAASRREWTLHVHPATFGFYPDLLMRQCNNITMVLTILYGPLPSLKRNHVIVDISDRLIATPASGESRSRLCIRTVTSSTRMMEHSDEVDDPLQS